jgi:hypothetical protein
VGFSFLLVVEDVFAALDAHEFPGCKGGNMAARAGDVSGIELHDLFLRVFSQNGPSPHALLLFHSPSLMFPI